MGKKKDKKEENVQPDNKNRKMQQRYNRKSSHRWILLSVLFLILALVVVISLFCIPGDLHYQVTETYTFSSDQMGSVNLSLLLPTSGPYQEILAPQVTWPGSWEGTSEGRLNVLSLQGDILAGQTLEAVITYQVHLWQGEAQWHGMPARSVDLAPQPDIQSDHLEIVEQAGVLEDPDSRMTTARRLFNFTMWHLRWPQETRINADLSALNAYRTGVGGCTEHANLMTALSRAAGIPAHTVSGLAMPEMVPFIPIRTTWDHPAGAHAWSEFYVRGAWYLADPSWSGDFFKRDLFGWTDGRHLVYDEIGQESVVYDRLLSEAEANGEWIGAMSAPLRFVAWSDVGIDAMRFTPEVSLRKTWDSRVVLMISIIVIILVLYWLARENPRSGKPFEEESYQ